MQASELPGGVVLQNNPHDRINGDCFSACISMLTGMPLEYVPVLPPYTEHLVFVENSETFLHVPNKPWTKENAAWRDMLADNGLKFDLQQDRPAEYPYMAFLMSVENHGGHYHVFGHSIVVISETEVVDPGQGVVKYIHDYPEVWYATVTPM